MTEVATRDAPDDAPGPEDGTHTPGRAAPHVLPVALVLLGGLALRLLLAYVIWPGEGLVSDLRLFTLWADVLAQHGPGGFYANAGFADYPPGYLYVLWIMGLVGQALAGPLGVAPADVVGPLVKLPAIAADMLVAILLYRAARRWWGERAGLIAAAVFLFVPVTWYDAAVWGQVDAVGALLLLGAVLLLIEGWSEPAVAVAALAAVTKPQYAIGLAVVGAVLVGRHLLRPSEAPVPPVGRWTGALDARLGGWFTRRRGWVRLVSSALVGAVVIVVALLPFDLPILAPADLAGIPVVGSIAGFVALVTSAAAYYGVLTVNAFNGWALVGPTPLMTALSHQYQWTYDSLAIVGGIPAVTVGTAALGLAALLVVATLVLRDDRWAILVGFTVLAVAFFALPTRVHERYLFPAFATGALLAAASVRWRWWYVLLGVGNAINLHAILTMPFEGYGTPAMRALPLGDAARAPITVMSVSLLTTVLFVLALTAFVRDVSWPAFVAVPASVRRWRDGRSREPAVAEPALAVAAAAVASAVPVGAPSVDTAVPVDASPAAAGPTGGAASGPGPAMSPWYAPLLPPAAGIRVDPGAVLGGASSRTLARFRGPVAGGRARRRDLAIVAVIVVLTFGTRLYRLETPRTEYFDEYWHATAAMELLQDWRYGMPHTLIEQTHPHLAKYAMAAGIDLFGADRVTAGGVMGSPVAAVAFEPSYADPALAGGRGGDRILVATGSAILSAEHGDIAKAMAIPVAGATSLAVDEDQHWTLVGTDDGSIWGISSASLSAAGSTGAPVTARRIGNVGEPIRGVWAVGDGRVLVRLDGDRLVVVDEATAAPLANTSIAGVRAILPYRVGDVRRIAVATPTGIVALDPATLAQVAAVPVDGGVTGLGFVDGNAYDKKARQMLEEPAIYAATGGPSMVATTVAPDGGLSLAATFPMPGPVADVRWDRPSNLLHVLGTAPSGSPTVYVVTPQSNAVFGDVALPFAPSTWVLDVQPADPSRDRERILTFSPSGAVVSVAIGSQSFGWRLPGAFLGALTVGLVYLLALVLFRRRSIALIAAGLLLVDGLAFQQARIAMNDVYVGFFIVAGLLLLAWLLRGTAAGRRATVELILLPPAIGAVLGLGLASKWVAMYAIGAAGLLFLLRSWLGRRLALAGMAALTGVLGYLAVADDPANLTFLLVMLALTAVLAVGIVRGEAREASGETPGAARGMDARWPRWRAAVPIAWFLACIVVVPAGVYVASYVPWALSTAGGPRLFPGWPAGNTGQTLLDLQAQMYAYHDQWRWPHGSGSPWWAWPLDLKPVWGYLETFVDGTQATILGAGNPFLLWASIPALGAGAWLAWRRRSWALGFGVVAFLCLWLPWARIDRVAFNYHYYVALPFAYLLLAWLLADLWERPTARLRWFGRWVVGVALYMPAILWALKGPLCVVAGADPATPVCAEPLTAVALPVAAWTALATVVLVIGVLRSSPRRMVAAFLGVAVVASIALYPALSAVVVPGGWPWVYQALLPSWDTRFAFASVTTLPSGSSVVSGGTVVVLLLAVGVVALSAWGARRWGKSPAPADGDPGRGPAATPPAAALAPAAAAPGPVAEPSPETVPPPAGDETSRSDGPPRP